MNEVQAKVVLVGDSGCGKSSIIYRYKTGNFNTEQDSTIGASFYEHLLDIGNKFIRLSIWDTAGQERYDSISSLYSRNSSAVIIVCDAARENPIESIKKWHEKIVKQILADDVAVCIAINKFDLVTKDSDFFEIEDFASHISATVFKTSAKENTNIDELFLKISNMVLEQKQNLVKSSFTLSEVRSTKSELNISNHKSCCS